ncbi:MAG: glycogen synthase [Elusimicrobiota bacterium]|nr:glycogen synthase [Elusimicrobiota bacterium]
MSNNKNTKLNILMAASECIPFVKTGGLADVVGTLPKELKSIGNDVRIILPKYASIDEKKFPLKDLPYKLRVNVGYETHFFSLKYYITDDGITTYFIENNRYFNRAGIYGDFGIDYPDNRDRYIFFNRAVLESMKALGFRPDIIHCHDWQTALLPAYLKTTHRNDGFYWNTACVYTIHNIAYQGSFGADTVEAAGFARMDFTPEKIEYYGGVNFMKSAITLADRVSTVSPSYALEIKDFNGRGMEWSLTRRGDKIYGILNGIDYNYWNPKTDKNIAANYSIKNMKGKSICKKDLQNLCGFDIDDSVYLFGCVTRLDWQKGVDVIIDAINQLKDESMQFVILGSGDMNIKRDLQNLASKYPKLAAAFFDYNEPLAHKIYAGCDAYMMPSRFEPCGLSQIIALAYGTIPIVNRVGGLSDTIEYYNHNNGQGNGFVFNLTYGENFVETIYKSEKIFKDKKLWGILMQNAFNCNFSWDKSGREYQNMYLDLIGKL